MLETSPQFRVEQPEGGKALPVNEKMRQLQLSFTTAENPQGAIENAAVDRSTVDVPEVPKVEEQEKPVTSATMEAVVSELQRAFIKVAANKGAPGIDGQTIEEVSEHWDLLLVMLEQQLLEGRYSPTELRRVYIKKAGGKRALGIPSVLDRVVGEAIRRVLEPMYEPTFHPNSHGFRPKRGCHTAIKQAQAIVTEGYFWVVDMDLSKFFDTVHHQRLMARLEEKIEDNRLRKLLWKMLKAGVVMPDGVKVSTEEGVPQGSPLSPLLSNIVLDELDRELDRRGHRFVRYADDCNVYVKSPRAGQRVMRSIRSFIEKKLRLKLNEAKSAVAQTKDRHFVGFSLRYKQAQRKTEIKLSKRSKERLRDRLIELTPRNWGNSLERCINSINQYIKGWLGYFGICTEVESILKRMDARTRRRLRAIQLKQWKRKKTIARKLIQLGVKRRTAYREVYEGNKGIWALSISSAVHRGIRNEYFSNQGLLSLAEMWREIRDNKEKTSSIEAVAPEQLTLPLG